MMRNQRLAMLLALPVLFLRVAFPASQASAETYVERQATERQPPEKVLPAIGVRPGMVIGEVGAGRGRYTVYLARGVGETGKIYANDINPKSLEVLRLRCQNEGIRNVETVLGDVDDPLFPKGALDMAFMVLTYHHLAKPVDLLKNLIPSLKPGAEIAIIDPDPVRDENRGGRESTSVEKIRSDAARAGLELVRVETFLEKDNIFILARPGVGQESVRPKEAGPAGAPYDPLKDIPAAALREDLKILWDAMEEGHGGFDRYTPRSVLEKGFDDVMNGLTAPMTEFDFFLKLMPLIAEIKDGHTRVQPSAAAGAYLDDQAIFPFGLRFLGGRAHIFRNLSRDRGIREGTELLAVNGMAVEEIVAGLLTLIPNDAGIQTRKLRQLEFPANFGRLFALRFGRPDSFRLRLRSYQTSDVTVTTVPGIRGKDVVRILNERYPDAAKRPPLYVLTFRGAAAVLTIRSFADDPEKGSTPYPEFLKNAFRALEEKKVPSLVIDLRDNGGGADEYGKLLFAYVMDRPFLYYRALEAKKDRYDLYKYSTISPKEAEELAKQVKKNAHGWFDILGHPNLGLQQPRSPRFTGKVAILINGLSFSATGETTSLFHYYKKAVFFGEECGAGYYGNTSGFMVTITLPNTKIQARIPLILYTMAVDGYPKDRGIVPDFPVSPTIEDLLAGRDPVMDRALAFLTKPPDI